MVVAKETLKNKVDRLMKTPAVVAPLASRGLIIVDVSAPKQTDTTQRWKVGLRGEGQSAIIRTKIEFSLRDSLDGSSYEAVNKQVTQRYSLPPFLASHYGTRQAILQKIRALAHRTEPQARDVFDLERLLFRSDAAELTLTPSETKPLRRAIENAMSISFDDYMAHVVSYLEPQEAELRASRVNWDTTQSNVVDRLQSFS